MAVMSVLIYWMALAETLIIAKYYTKVQYLSILEHFLWIAAISFPLAMIAGFRTGVGTDYYNYVRIFEQVRELTLWQCMTHAYWDVLFITFVRILFVFTSNIRVIFFILIWSMIMLAVSAIARCRKYIDFLLCIFFYYLIIYHPSLNILRQCIAASFLLWVVVLAVEKKYIKSLIVCALGMLVHNTLILGAGFCAVAWLSNKYIKRKAGVIERKSRRIMYAYYLLILVSPLLVPVALHILIQLPVFSGYAHYQTDVVRLGIGQLFLSVFLFLPLLWSWKKIVRNGKLLSLFHIVLLYIPISYAGYYFEYASRLNLYTQLLIALLVCQIVGRLKKKQYAWIISGWYTLFFVLQYVNEILLKNYHETFPYTF